MKFTIYIGRTQGDSDGITVPAFRLWDGDEALRRYVGEFYSMRDALIYIAGAAGDDRDFSVEVSRVAPR
jgi:hypothetical protein